MHRRLSIALLLLALSSVGEPAYALWKVAADHACCLPKPAAAQASCHGMAHHAAGNISAALAAGHHHSDCAHDCCTKQRTASNSAIIARAVAVYSAEGTEIVSRANAEISPNAGWSSLSERGPPSLS